MTWVSVPYKYGVKYKYIYIYVYIYIYIFKYIYILTRPPLRAFSGTDGVPKLFHREFGWQKAASYVLS